MINVQVDDEEADLAESDTEESPLQSVEESINAYERLEKHWNNLSVPVNIPEEESKEDKLHFD